MEIYKIYNGLKYNKKKLSTRLHKFDGDLYDGLCNPCNKKIIIYYKNTKYIEQFLELHDILYERYISSYRYLLRYTCVNCGNNLCQYDMKRDGYYKKNKKDKEVNCDNLAEKNISYCYEHMVGMLDVNKNILCENAENMTEYDINKNKSNNKPFNLAKYINFCKLEKADNTYSLEEQMEEDSDLEIDSDSDEELQESEENLNTDEELQEDLDVDEELQEDLDEDGELQEDLDTNKESDEDSEEDSDMEEFIKVCKNNFIDENSDLDEDDEDDENSDLEEVEEVEEDLDVYEEVEEVEVEREEIYGDPNDCLAIKDIDNYISDSSSDSDLDF